MSFDTTMYWNGYYRKLRESGDDLDWHGQWTDSFLDVLRAGGVRTVLELGCGTGNDAARLAREGYAVTATDGSLEAIDSARAKFGGAFELRVTDMTEPLPFADDSFDAVMSNVALHMFPDAVTRQVFAEVGRVVRPGGLFLLHVNAIEDRPLRARWRPGARELEPDFIIEPSGQTMHFFSGEYLRDLLAGWRDLRLDPILITHPETGEPFKQVWRGVAHR